MNFPFEEKVEPESVGMSAKKLEKVVNTFKQQHVNGGFPGGQLVVRRQGKIVANEAIGVARGFRPEEPTSALNATPETLFPVYSTGKPLAGVAIAILEDKGLLDINAPIAEIFPEFAKNGKEQITTLDVLTHRSGILLPHLAGKFNTWQNKEEVKKQLADAVPVHKRGTLAYQPGEFGWILSEVVSRIDGRELADFIEQEVITPLQLTDLQFGLNDRKYDSIALTGKVKIR